MSTTEAVTEQTGATTTLGNGTDPGNASLAPGGAATMADAFTLQTSSGTDTITAATVTLSAGTSGGLSLVEITNDAGTTVYGSVTNPASDTPAISLTTNITATTTSTQYKIRVTPKTHAAMPAPVGSTYNVTAYISNWTGANTHAGSDSGGTTVIIDNQSPGDVSGSTAVGGNGQVSLSWSNPVDADLGSILVLRRTVSAVTDVPVEGATYSVGNTIGSSTVACVVTVPGTSCIDGGLVNGTAYYYKIFTLDSSGNYSTGATPSGSPATPAVSGTAQVYYSVGQNTANHMTGSPTVTISGGTATFSVMQTASNMGVGDKVTYNGSTVAYISGKISYSIWTLVTATGGTPADVSSVTVNSIAHAFSSLSAAFAGASGASYLNTADLVAGKYILNIPCYYDTGSDTTAVTVSGYTTGTSNYINVYTPYNTFTQVNQSQRHTGTWTSTAYTLAVSGANALAVSSGSGNIRLEGLQVSLTGAFNAIEAKNLTTVSDTRISNSIVKGVSVGVAAWGIFTGAVQAGSTLRVWNNQVSDFNAASAEAMHISSSTNLTSYIYNNTITNSVLGISSPSGTSYAKNNLCSSCTTAASGTFAAGTDYNATNNASMGYTVTGGGNTHDRLSQTFTFVNAGAGDFHLGACDSGAKDYGVSLSGDAGLPFSNDIDGQSRPIGAAWDIGADEGAGGCSATTTVTTGADPGNTSLAPGGAATMADAFTLQTSAGTDKITAATVTLSVGSSGGLSLVEITNDAGTFVYGSVTNQGSDTPLITLSNQITATTTLTQYKIRVTPKTHAAMPAPPGSTYSVTAYISAFTGTNAQAGSDTGGTTVTIDNLSPGNVTAATATASGAQVSLSWTNPADTDLGSIVVLRKTGGAVADTPVEGTTYSVGNTIGSSTVACVVTGAPPATTCTDTGLTNGTAYYYKIFAKDTNGNYSATGTTPTGSPATPTATISGTVYTDEGVTNIGVGKTVRLLVNGASVGTAVTDASGNYSLTANANAGDALLVFISADATYKGTAVTVSSGANLSGLNIYAGYVITRQDNSGTLTNANMNTAKGAYAGADAGDIHYSVSGGNLTVSGTDVLYVPSGAAGSFAPGANVTTPAMKSLGTFTGGAGSITINGALTVAGGTYTATSGTTTTQGDFTVSAGTFNHNSGAIAMTGSSSRTVNIGGATLNNVTINITGGGAVTVTGTVTVGGNLTLTAIGAVSTGTIAVAGNVTTTAAIVGSSPTGTILFNGSGAQTLSVNGAGGTGTLAAAVSINKPSGTLTIQDTVKIFGSNGWTWTAGTVNAGTSTIEIAKAMTVNAGSMAFNNVLYSANAGGALTVTGAMTINGDLTITSLGSITGGTVAVAGNVTTTATPTGANPSGTILFNGGGAQTLSASGGTGALAAGVIINKLSGTLTIQDAIQVYGSNGWTWTAGTVNAGASTVEFYANGMTVNAGSMAFNNANLNLSAAHTLTITGTLTVNGALTVAGNSIINTGTIAVAGNVTSTATSASGTVTITLNGTGAQTITASGGADLPNGTLTINKTSGTATLASALAPTGGMNVTVNQGMLDLASYNLSGITTLTVNNGATLQLQGGETVTAATKTFNSGSTVVYNGGSTYASLAAGNNYSNLTFNNVAGSWTHTGALTANNLTITAGALISGGQNINCSGNWSNSGAYTSGANTVTFNGAAQAITGNTTFNNLTKSVASADTLTFAAGSTTTINGLATINGAAGQLLSLRSSTPGARWNFNVAASATKTISFVDVQDSDASGSAAAQKPIAPSNSADSGNTVEWFSFNLVKQVWQVGGSAPLAASNGSPTSTTVPSGQTIVFLIYVKNTTASALTDIRFSDLLDVTASGFNYVAGSLVRTSAATPPADTATDKQIFDATAPGTGTNLIDAVDADVASVCDSTAGACPGTTLDRVTVGNTTGLTPAQANGTLSVAANSTFALRFQAVKK